MDDENQVNSDTSTQDDVSTDTDNNDASQDDSSTEWEEKYQNQKIRAEKAEREAKELKQKLASAQKAEQKETVNQPTPQGISREEAIVLTKLQALGMEPESLDQVQKIASLEGVSVVAAMETDTFKIWQEKLLRDKKSRESQMGASKGSGTVRKEKSLTTPGLTIEERKALWRERMGK